jgi:hypothetical protein
MHSPFLVYPEANDRDSPIVDTKELHARNQMPLLFFFGGWVSRAAVVSYKRHTHRGVFLHRDTDSPQDRLN